MAEETINVANASSKLPIDALGMALQGAQMVADGFESGKLAKESGASTGEAVIEGALGAFGLDGLYKPQGIKNRENAQEIANKGINDTERQIMENQSMTTKKGSYKKSLAAMTGTIAHNMPVSQYNSAIKMSGIAKNMDEPIKRIDPMYNNKTGVQQDDFEQYK